MTVTIDFPCLDKSTSGMVVFEGMLKCFYHCKSESLYKMAKHVTVFTSLFTHLKSWWGVLCLQGKFLSSLIHEPRSKLPGIEFRIRWNLFFKKLNGVARAQAFHKLRASFEQAQNHVDKHILNKEYTKKRITQHDGTRWVRSSVASLLHCLLGMLTLWFEW